MSGFVAIEWARDALRGLDADVSKAGVHVRLGFVLSWPEEPDVRDDPERAGEWLRSELGRLGVRGRRMLVTLPREDIVMRPLQLPETSDATLPDVVRYQASAQSAVPLDQIEVDYLPARTITAEGGRAVLMAAAPRRLLNQIHACIEAAGYEPAPVGVTALSCCEIVARVEDERGYIAQDGSLVIAVVGQRMEISLCRSGDVLFAHGTRAADQQESLGVSAEVQRALVAHDTAVGNTRIARAWLISDSIDSQTVCDHVANSLGCEVCELDPFVELQRDVRIDYDPGTPAEFAGPLGALLGQFDPVLQTIDFRNPRKSVVKPKRTKLLVGMVVAALCVIIGGTYGGVRLYLNSLADQIADRQSEDQQLESALTQGEPVLQMSEFLDDLESRRVDWLDQMQQISLSMPGTERIYLERWRFDAVSGDVVGRVHADGFARERQDVEVTNQRLADLGGFRVRPNAIRSHRGDPEYPVRYELDADLVVPAATEDATAAKE